MNFDYTETQGQIRAAVKELCKGFGPEYWRQCAQDGAYPEAFVDAMAKAGWLAALIPEEYGGAGLPLLDACLILQEINQNGGSAVHCHAQMYTMASILRHGSEAQKRATLPRIADGSLRLQAFGVTEPDAGSNTLAIKTFARKVPGGYVANGQKIWTSRYSHSHMYLLIARTTPIDAVKKKTDGLSLFLIDIAKAGASLKATPIRTMINHHTFQVFIDNLELSDDDRIGEEGKGFYYLLDSLHSERLLVASEAIGDGHWFVGKAARYGSERVVFDRPIGANQGVQFPIADAFIELEAANLMRWKACEKIDAMQNAGAEANMAKYLAAKASWEAANVCLQTHGGFGFACEYDIERKFRETRLYQVAPVSTNMIFSYVAEHILGLPRSF